MNAACQKVKGRRQSRDGKLIKKVWQLLSKQILKDAHRLW